MGKPGGEGNIDREQALTDALEETAPTETPHSDRTGLLQGVRQGVARALDTLESNRSSSRIVDTVLFAKERNERVPATLLAGSLASRLVVYTIPFFVLTIVVTGLYSDVSNSNPAEAARDAGMAGLLADAVVDSTEASDGFRAITLISMAFATVWAADSLGKLVRRIYALVWATPLSRPQRRWAVPLAVLVVSVGGLAISRLGHETQEWPVSLALGEVLAEAAVVALFWLVVSRFLPHDPEAHGWIYHAPGALLLASGVVGMRAAMVLYFAPRAVTLSARYGDVASAAVLITWAYWIAFILVASVELNAAVFRSSQRRNPTT